MPKANILPKWKAVCKSWCSIQGSRFSVTRLPLENSLGHLKGVKREKWMIEFNKILFKKGWMSHNLKEKNLKGALTFFRCEKAAIRKTLSNSPWRLWIKQEVPHIYTNTNKENSKPGLGKNFWTSKVIHKTAQSPSLEFMNKSPVDVVESQLLLVACENTNPSYERYCHATVNICGFMQKWQAFPYFIFFWRRLNYMFLMLSSGLTI